MKPIKFTIKRGDEPNEKLELTISGGSNLEDMEHTFRVILKWLSYIDDSINEMFGHEEYSEELLKRE